MRGLLFFLARKTDSLMNQIIYSGGELMNIMYLYYLLIVAAVIIVTYAAMRWIDYGFGQREARHEAAAQAATDARRYRMAKGCIQTYTAGQQRMAMDMVKRLNDGIYEMGKKFEEDL